MPLSARESALLRTFAAPGLHAQHAAPMQSRKPPGCMFNLALVLLFVSLGAIKGLIIKKSCELISHVAPSPGNLRSSNVSLSPALLSCLARRVVACHPRAEGGALRTSRAVFVRCMYGPVYGALYGALYGVCTAAYTAHRATYGLEKRPTDTIIRKNVFSITEKSSFWMCVSVNPRVSSRRRWRHKDCAHRNWTHAEAPTKVVQFEAADLS
jgi:hypothetical protein